jgi:hypothetical protein
MPAICLKAPRYCLLVLVLRVALWNVRETEISSKDLEFVTQMFNWLVNLCDVTAATSPKVISNRAYAII